MAYEDYKVTVEKKSNKTIKRLIDENDDLSDNQKRTLNLYWSYLEELRKTSYVNKWDRRKFLKPAKSVRTREKYIRDIVKFAEFIKKDFMQITKEDIEDYKLYLKKTPLEERFKGNKFRKCDIGKVTSPKSVANYCNVIKIFFIYLYQKEGLNRVNLMSIHKSKGLQAKVVIIFDVVQGLYGFPCELENLSIFNIATLNEFENEKEERRLFYVALTRAKEELYIYTMKAKESKFLKEISKYTNVEHLSYDVNEDKGFSNYL